MFVAKSWDFKTVVLKIEALKSEYKETLASFSIFELHEKVEYMRKMKNSVYNLKMNEQKKDKIWNYLNDNEYLSVLKSIAERE